jgi:hypothetical protein
MFSSMTVPMTVATLVGASRRVVDFMDSQCTLTAATQPLV